jgi:hypothetical protein
MATQHHNATARSGGGQTKQRLVRGVDPIPQDWGIASAYLAVTSLRRSRTILKKLISEAMNSGNRTLARDLRRVDTGVRRGFDNLTGGFDRREIIPVAKQFKLGRALAAKVRS